MGETLETNWHIAGCGMPASYVEVREYCAQRNIVIPTELDWFLTHACNGGYPRGRPEFPVNGPEEYAALAAVISIAPNAGVDDLAKFARNELTARIRPRVWPIGADQSDGPVVVIGEGPCKGQICSITEDEYHDGRPNPTLYHVAPNIQEFVRMIKRWQQDNGYA